MQFLGVRSTSAPWFRGSGSRATASFFDEKDIDIPPFGYEAEPQPDTSRDRALAMLRMADLGVEDVEIVDDEVVNGNRRYSGRRIRLVHRAATGSLPLEMDAESAGTRAWFELIGPVLHALQSGFPVVFDELDNSLHPALSSHLIRLFQDRETNPWNAQLIFSTHDTSLLDHLTRDEVWFTEKRVEGSTALTPLADFSSERVRRSVDLESGYLHGRFGGLPDVDRTEMLRALGLIG